MTSEVQEREAKRERTVATRPRPPPQPAGPPGGHLLQAGSRLGSRLPEAYSGHNEVLVGGA